MSQLSFLLGPNKSHYPGRTGFPISFHNSISFSEDHMFSLTHFNCPSCHLPLLYPHIHLKLEYRLASQPAWLYFISAMKTNKSLRISSLYPSGIRTKTRICEKTRQFIYILNSRYFSSLLNSLYLHFPHFLWWGTRKTRQCVKFRYYWISR